MLTIDASPPTWLKISFGDKVVFIGMAAIHVSIFIARYCWSPGACRKSNLVDDCFSL